MFLYKLEYTIEKTLSLMLSSEQAYLRQISGIVFSKDEAKGLFDRIDDHKWYASERLGRDNGLKVAATDYFENIYEHHSKSQRRNGFGSNLRIFRLASFSIS